MNIRIKSTKIFGLFLTIITFSFSTLAKSPDLTKKELSVPPPRIIRTCCGFGAEIGITGVPFAKKTDITSIEIMGEHHFMGGHTEKNGIIYTRRGGFIDLGHLRDCADWTAWLYDLIKTAESDEKFLTTELRHEGGDKTLTLALPANMDENAVIELAGKIAYDLSLWHEISTWFGARYVPLVPEKFSSFSPEDMYSNLLGVHLGMRSIKSELPYDDAMTTELSNMLDSLQTVKTVTETYKAMMEVNNVWYTNSKKYPKDDVTIKRYFVTGNELTPWLIPGENCILPPYSLHIPDKSNENFYQLILKLNYRFPVDTLFYDKNDRIITQKDFDAILDFIKNEVQQKEMIQSPEPTQKTKNGKNKKQKGKKQKQN
jgi:hypothetical protein